MKTKSKKKAATHPEPEPEPSKGKKKSSSQPRPPPVQAPVNGSSTIVKQADPVVTTKSTIPDEADFNLPQHTPSYVGISCAILGYGLYNRYNGSPGPSLQVSPLSPGGTNQLCDEVDSTGPVTRLIAQFEALKKQQAAKAAAEYQAYRSLDEVAREQGEFLPTLSPPSEAPVKKYPPVMTETKTKADERIIQNEMKKEPVKQVTPPPPKVVEEKRVVEERNVSNLVVGGQKIVDDTKTVRVSPILQNVEERKKETCDEKFESHVQEITEKQGLHVEEDVVVTSRGSENIEQIAVVEHVASEEEQEDVSLVLSESRSEYSQHLPTSESPVFEDRSESDTGSVRIHDTPEPSESIQEHLFNAIIQSQQSPSPLLADQSPEQEIMKQEFIGSAQIVEQSEEENAEDELSTRVQVSDSNEEVMMRGAPIESTSSRKTSIESDGSNEALVRDGKWFLSQYELVCDEVRPKITQAESDLEVFSGQMSEDVEGRVRAGVGKAKLLINSKLKQFHDLCIKNIVSFRSFMLNSFIYLLINQENSMTDGCETKIEDLEGYWEMVSYQIEDVHHTFDEIDSMRQNKWTVVPVQEMRHEVRFRNLF